MGASASVKVDVSKLRNLAGEIDPRASQLIRKTALDVESEAKTRVAVDTGNLKNSGYTHVENNGLTATVGFSAEYAIYVEFGTGSQRKTFAERDASGRFLKKENYNTPGGKKGMRPKPYLIPALNKFKQSFIAAWKELIKQNERS